MVRDTGISAIIETRDLRRSFTSRRGTVEVVAGVDLRLDPGEIFGFLGPNGAGKTTTLRMLATLLPPTAGDATVVGCDLRREPARVRELTGYVSQRGSTDPAITGRTELIFQARLYGMNADTAKKRAAEMLATLELDGCADRPSGTYSGGQKRRLDIGLSLFGAAFVGFSLIGELRYGVVERMRVTPVSRVAMLLGRALRDVLILLIQSLMLIVLSLPFGLKVNLIGLLIVLGLLALIGLVTASSSYALALWLRSEDALAPMLSTVTLPLLLLSGVLLPLSLAPAWIRAIAAINPLSYAVDAARAIFNDQLGDPSVIRGVAIMVVLTVIALWVAARSFANAAS